jgi:hypothetical protein
VRQNFTVCILWDTESSCRKQIFNLVMRRLYVVCVQY